MAGKHVFLRRAAGNDRRRAAGFIAAADESNGIVAVGFNRRFSPLLIEFGTSSAAAPKSDHGLPIV